MVPDCQHAIPAPVQGKVEEFRHTRQAHKEALQRRFIVIGYSVILFGLGFGIVWPMEATSILLTAFIGSCGVLILTTVEMDYNIQFRDRPWVPTLVFGSFLAAAVSNIVVTQSSVYIIGCMPSLYFFWHMKRILAHDASFPTATDWTMLVTVVMNSCLLLGVGYHCSRDFIAMHVPFTSSSELDSFVHIPSESCVSFLEVTGGGADPRYILSDFSLLPTMLLLVAVSIVSPTYILFYAHREGSRYSATERLIYSTHALIFTAGMHNAHSCLYLLGLDSFPHILALLSCLATMLMVIVVAFHRRSVFGFLAQRFEKEQTVRDGAFVIELLDHAGQLYQVGQPYWVKRKVPLPAKAKAKTITITTTPAVMAATPMLKGGSSRSTAAKVSASAPPPCILNSHDLHWERGIVRNLQAVYDSEPTATTTTTTTTRTSRTHTHITHITAMTATVELVDSKPLSCSTASSPPHTHAHAHAPATRTVQVQIPIGAKEPAEMILSWAKDHLHCIDWSTIHSHPLLLETSDANANGIDTFALSRPLRSQEGERIDAFVSHSWHDDFRTKLAQLTAYAEEFKAAHGREPVLWFDKFCIDQKRINDSLRMLPVAVTAADKVLVLYGPTYTSRLWCVLELYCVFAFSPDPKTNSNSPKAGDRIMVQFDPSSTTNQQQEMASRLRLFAAADARCFDPNEEAKLRHVIRATGETKFNANIRELGGLLQN